MPIYFALEGIVGSGKMTLLEWLKVMLLPDGHTFYMIPEPVNKFKKKVTYNPLEECYKCPEQSTVMAQIHIMCNSDLSPLRFCRIKRMHWSRTSTVDLINTIKAQFEFKCTADNMST